MEKNKKILIIIGICLLGGLLCLSFFVGNDTNQPAVETLSEDPNEIIKNAQTQSANIKDSEKKDYKEIKMSDYLEYYAGSESKIILIGYPTCPFCQIAEPILKNLAYEYDLEINYLNTDNFTDEDEATLLQSDEYFRENEGFGTPLILIVKDNKILNKIDGLTDRGHYKKLFEEEGFIK